MSWFIRLIMPVTVAMTILALGWLFLGSRLSELSISLSLLALALSAAWSFSMGKFFNVMLGEHQGSDAPTLATLGPEFFSSVLALSISFVALLFAIGGASKLAIGLNIAAVGVTVFALAVLGGAQRIVLYSESAQSPRSAHTDWYHRLKVLSIQTSDFNKQVSLRDLSEQCRFASSDGLVVTPQNNEIATAIEDLNALIANGQDEFQAGVDRVKRLLRDREAYLQLSRSKV